MRLDIKQWSRRKKITVGAIAGAVVVTVGAAIAALLFRVPFTGGGNIQAPPDVAVQSVNVTNSENATCTADTTTGRDVALNFEGFSGGWCELTLQLLKSGGGTLKVQGFEFATVTNDRVRASDCGRELLTGTATTIVLRVTANGQTGPFTAAADAGIVAVDNYVDANCLRF